MMKKIARGLPVFLLAFCLTGIGATRSDTLLDTGWRFYRGDAQDAAGPAFNDDGWSAVTVPHCWNAIDGEKGGDYYRGPGWYRHALELPATDQGRRIFLRFEGASQTAKVFVNGTEAGEHLGGFGAFCLEITAFVKFGASNVIAVCVDNSKRADLAPLAGDFTIFGGIYRPVHLLVTDPVCLSPLDHASPGVTVQTLHVSDEKANVTIEALVSNSNAAADSVQVATSIMDATGQVVARTSEEISVPAGITQREMHAFTLLHPHLWNGRADPYLYTAVVELRRGDAVIDRIEQPLGLRYIRIDRTGFYLNGKLYPLHGVNTHQDALDKGWAISDADQKRDLDFILELGANSVRAAHYQHSETFYRLCDETGLLVWAELPQVNFVGASHAFEQNSCDQLLDLIRQNINHPSIFTWSLSNELRQPSADPDFILHDLNNLAHAEDPTRPTIQAAYINIWPSVNEIPDLIGINAYPGWYHGTIDDMGPEIDKDQAWGHGEGFCMSEYGAGASIHQHEANPKQPAPKGRWHPEEWQALVHEHDWAAIRAHPMVWGSFLWCMFDFASDSRNEGDTPGRNDKGLVTYDRKIRKDAFYFYKAQWSNDPFVYITDRRFTPRTDPATEVKIYSNCDRVELAVNGVSHGMQKGDDEHIFRWPAITLKPGENRIEATATRGGKTFTDSCAWVVNANTPKN
ncbi:MAG TPA: glycoside hydrolase family 2 TIM barrel-domain containing protein [Opitutaceae bacterium]|nr:glycoside hydrolase family 2 TIM barrel-domain containing protein [Opitutaceae bacterium]